MSDQTAILAALQAIPELGGHWVLEQISGQTFRARNMDCSIFVKWITADDPRGQNEVEIGRKLLANAPISTPRLMYVIPVAADILAVWEWIDGKDLRWERRELLPEAFRRLGAFHFAQRGSSAISSPVTGNSYTTVEAFLAGETRLLCADLSPIRYKRCAGILDRLSCGYPTFIHGDMHPGNLCATPSGPVFVDWGFSRRSINLLDLDYIHSLPVQPPETDWWVIQPEEAEDVLSAYFSTCGLAGVNIREIHHAVMVWGLLWSLYNARNSDKALRSLSQQRLENLLEVQP
jgi:Ser/Thr protein kinase RdoA (MazF antagonist)